MKSLFRTFLEILILPLKQRIARISTATGSRVSPRSAVVGNAEKSSSAPSSEETEFEELVTQYVAVEMSDAYGTRLAADEEENVPHLVPEDFSVLSRFLDPVEENDVLVADMDEEVGEGKRLEVPTAVDVPVIEIETHPEIVEKPIVEAVQPPLFQEMVSPTPTIDTPITSELLNPEQLELNDESGEDQAVNASAQIDDPSFSELEFTVSDHEQPSPTSVHEDLVIAVDSALNLDKEVAPIPDLPSTDVLPIFDVSSLELIDVPEEEATLTWQLSDEVRFQFDKHEPETSLKDELDNFLEQLAMGGIRASLSISEIEQLLRLAFRRVELIGELPVSREAFEQLSAILRGRFAPNGRRLSLRDANCPALFSTTMVFCARYSDEDARSFWRPFAQKVWHLKGTDQSFQVMCANFFFKSRLYLEERYSLIFPVINRGDVVRPLYRHAILPFYLQSDFAAWLIRNLRLMQDVALEHLPSQLAETKLDYESKSLKQFIRAEETRETAYHLIRQMKRAIDLFAQEGDSDAVRTELSSPIERELWDQIAHVLTQTVERRASTRQAQTRLEWVWSLEDDEMFLRLLNLRVTDEAGKPDVCQWVKQQGMPVHGDGVTEYLRPWENHDGWLVDEVLIPAPSSTGWIYVLSEEGDILYENPVPPLPTKPYMLFRLTQQRQYGIPVDDAEIAEGDWLLSTAAGIAIHTDHGQILTPREIREPTSMLRETAAHRNAGVYELHPPTRLLKDGSVIAEWGKKQTTVGQPSIEGDSPLADISVSVPPVFMSRDIYLRIPQFNERANRITLSLKGGSVNLVLRMDRLLETGRAEVSADEIVVHLGELIPDANATYLVNLRRDLQSILPSPLQFTLLTGIEVAPPNPDIIYSPTCLPSVRIQGLEAEHVELPQGSTLQTVDQALFVEWHELKDNVCKLRLRFSHTIIPLAWSINRVNAWIEGVDGDSIYEGQLIGVTLRARGNRYDSLHWIMESGDTTDSRDITLNARGSYDNPLGDDALFDQIRGISGQLTVSAEMRGMRWHVFTYQGHKRARPVEPAVPPQETVEIKKPSFKAYKSGLNLSTPSTPARRERVEINASLDDQHLMAELLSSVGQNKQVVLKPSDYARLAKMPVSAYLDASPNELSAIWTGLVRLAEVHQTVEWKPRPNWAVTVVDRLFTENQLQAPKSRYTINLDKFHTVEGYRFAADNWITEYRRSRDDQKQLVNGSWIRSMRLLRRELQVYQSFPMIRLTLELVQAVSGEPETGFHSSLLHLDEVVLLLALLMRLNVYHSQIGMRVRANANFTHKNVPQLEDMLYTAKQACPALLLWALTWVETFCVYDQSQRG